MTSHGEPVNREAKRAFESSYKDVEQPTGIYKHPVGDLNLQEPIGGQAGCQHHPVDIVMGRPGFGLPALGLKPELLNCLTQTRVIAQGIKQ
jgi:hypothetical protein